MGKIKDIIDLDKRESLIEKTLQNGQIIRLFSHYTKPPKPKFCVIVKVEPFVLFYINSDECAFAKNNEEIKRLQIKLSNKRYPCFDRESILDCSYLELKITKDEFIKQANEKSSDYGIKGELSNKEIEDTLTKISNSRRYTQIEKDVIIESLGN